jgi:hypothetical protein
MPIQRFSLRSPLFSIPGDIGKLALYQLSYVRTVADSTTAGRLSKASGF